MEFYFQTALIHKMCLYFDICFSSLSLLLALSLCVIPSSSSGCFSLLFLSLAPQEQEFLQKQQQELDGALKKIIQQHKLEIATIERDCLNHKQQLMRGGRLKKSSFDFSTIGKPDFRLLKYAWDIKFITGITCLYFFVLSFCNNIDFRVQFPDNSWKAREVTQSTLPLSHLSAAASCESFRFRLIFIINTVWKVEKLSPFFPWFTETLVKSVHVGDNLRSSSVCK